MGEPKNNVNGDGNGIALVMITIDRSKQGKTNYLATTLENINRSIPSVPSIAVEWAALFLSTPECSHHLGFANWFDYVNQPETPRNACENAGIALQFGGSIANERGLSWVLFCEDDLDFCGDFIGSVSRWLDDHGNVNDPRSSQYRLFAFGAAYPQVADAARKSPAGSAWHYPYRAFYGTQCFAIRPDDAISLGSYIASNPLIRGVRNPNAYDLMFHDWMDANYPDGAFLASVPSFVQHIGRQSICTGKEITHTFDSWPGREWSYRGRGKVAMSGNVKDTARKRAFIVLGPESSGTRLFTSILIAGGCHGSAEHVQPIDDPDYDISPYENVVWRRSVPHGGQELDMQALIERLNRHEKREITVVVVRRDLDCNAKSQVAWGHSSDYVTACEKVKSSQATIEKAIAFALGDQDKIKVDYDGFVKDPVRAQRALWSLLGLPGGVPVEIRDENKKWHVEKARAEMQKLETELQRIEQHPRVLFVGDSPTVSTGFSLCTRQVCAHLHSLGWDVHVLGLSYFGDPHLYPYPIYPCTNPLDNSRDVYGCERLPKLINAIRPDIVVLLNDPWNVEAYLFNIDRYERINGVKLRNTFKLVAWLAVDGKNTHAHDFNHSSTKPDKSTKYGQLDYLAVWTEFAADELILGGWDGPAPTVIPLAVDGDVFKPVDKAQARTRTLPEKIRALNPFIIGVVGRNQYRKRLDLAIAYFAEWIKCNQIDDAYLYLHCAPTGDKGVDIRSLVKYHGVPGRVILTETCLGVGIDERDMAVVYSSFDLLMTMTQGEGFGLTTLEAMSCGCATMGPDWSGLGSDGGWTKNAMIQVPCTSTALTAPIGGNMYTIGGIADKELAIATLDVMYRDRHLLEGFARAGKELADTLTWDRTVTMFEEMLRGVLGVGAGDADTDVDVNEIEVSA